MWLQLASFPTEGRLSNWKRQTLKVAEEKLGGQLGCLCATKGPQRATNQPKDLTTVCQNPGAAQGDLGIRGVREGGGCAGASHLSPGLLTGRAGLELLVLPKRDGFGTHGWLWFRSTALPNRTQLSAGDAQIKEQPTASQAGEKSA